MISAKDDEPQFVRDFYGKSLKWVFAAIFLPVGIYGLGFALPERILVQSVSLLSFVLLMGSWVLWARKHYPPVHAWREAWMKEHQLMSKNDHESKPS